MRRLMICFLVLNVQTMFGQLNCDTLQSVNLIGDYPPGCTMCATFFSGNNTGYTPDPDISYDFPCGEVENSVWYSFYSRAEDFASLDVFVNDCTKGKGLEVAVYDKDFNRVSFCTVIENEENELINLRLPARQLFHVVVDGIDGDECDFLVFSRIPAANNANQIIANPANTNYCVGAEVCFYKNRDFAIENFKWEIPASDSIIGGGLNEEEICVKFNSEGSKNISLKVENHCSEIGYSKSIVIEEGQSLFVESFTSTTDTYCVGDEVQFDVVWNNDSVDLRWIYRFTEIEKLAGGSPTDTFFRGKIIGAGNLTMHVTPQSDCGLTYHHPIFATYGTVPHDPIEKFVCKDGCLMIADSCYKYYEDNVQLAYVGPNQFGCDSAIWLYLISVDVLPSPNIACEQTDDGIMINWEYASGAAYYVVFANQDSIATVTDNSYFLDTSLIGSPLAIKVQPVGECTYLPAEINCSELISNTNTIFLNNKISVYPNPTNGHLTIETDLKIREIEVYDTAGRFLQKEKTTSINLINRAAGIYFLKIKTNEGVAVKRILMN